ncbi:MAG TPA: hypothetical protein VFW59_09315 [Gallionella sp.]|nr:hypothetical protein [Gallionella sp.]
MKQAKQRNGKQEHTVCGNCARTIKVRHDSDNLVCLAHLHFVPTSHDADCEDFKPHAASEKPPSSIAKIEP